MEELIANLEEDLDLLLYDREPTAEESKIATDIAKILSRLKWPSERRRNVWQVRKRSASKLILIR